MEDHPGALKFHEVYDFLRASTKNENFGKPLPHGHRNRKGASKRDRRGRVLDNRAKSPRFYGIGGLIATLICGDLVLAGLISMPSPEEMGELVKELKMGALAGLQKLGLTSDISSKDDVRNAFSELSRHLESHLSPIERETMGYSVLMVEHALCKYSRLRGKRQKAKGKAGKRKRKVT